MNSVRKPPIGAVYLAHLPREPGKCDWCGLPCDERTPVRKQLRQTHYACSDEISQICQPDKMRDAIWKRDRGICIDCGEDWSDRYRFRKGVSVGMWLEWTDETRADKALGFYSYTEVLWISLWHGDHKVPLWKVRHMPDIERIEYFKLANLVTRCEPCHAFKTKDEAAERAHHNALAKQNVEKPKRKLQSAGFNTTLRRRMNGKVERRT